MAASETPASTLVAAAHDTDLALRAKVGDRGAFGELVRRHGSAVRGFVRRLGVEPALADKVARDAFIKAFDQITELRGELAFRSFVKQIAAQRLARRRRCDVRARAMLWAAPDSAGPVVQSADGVGAPARPGLSSDAGPACIEAAALKAPLGAARCFLRRALDRLGARFGGRPHPEGSPPARLDGWTMADARAERGFKAKVNRMVPEAAVFGDADLFTVRVSDRFNRGWTARRALVGALGLVGGMAVVHAASLGVLARVQALPHTSSAAIGRALGHVTLWRLSVASLPFAWEVIWMPVALAALAVALVLARVIKEI